MNVYRCHLTLLAPSKEHSHLWLCEMSSQVSGSGMPEEMGIDTLLYVASYSQSFYNTPHKIITYRKQKTFLILDITFQYVSTVNNSYSSPSRLSVYNQDGTFGIKLNIFFFQRQQLSYPASALVKQCNQYLIPERL